MNAPLRMGQEAPWFLRRPLTFLLGTYALLRLLNLLILVGLAWGRGERWSTYILSWDSQWLIQAARDGWPILNLSASTEPLQSRTWAWPPLAPLLARWTGFVFGGGAIESTLVAVNLLGGAVAAIVLFKLVTEFWGARAGFLSAVIWMAMPASPVLVMGYAEGLFVAFAFSALWALQRHRYIVAAALLIPAGLTKLQVVPFAMALVGVVIYRWWRSGFTTPRLPVVVTSVLLAGISMFTWPVYVAVRLGSLDAYSQVRSTWNHESMPFLNTINWLEWLFSSPNRANVFAALGLAVSVVAAIWVIRAPLVPISMKWVGGLTPIFFAFAGAGVSTIRYLFPDPVIALMLTKLVRRGWHGVVLGSALVLSQIAWIVVFVAADPGSTPP